MLTVGDKFPAFRLQAAVGSEKGKEFQEITGESYAGKWRVVFFWPMDFTFICPTEIAEFGRKNRDFADRDTQVLGASTDTHFVHLAWRSSHPDLKDLPYPMLADTKRELSSELGILHKQDGVALRATFIVDPEGIIRWASVNDLSVGRNVDEVARARRAADRRAVPLQLEEGRADAGGGVTMHNIDKLREAMPEAAKDIKLNLQSVLQGGVLTPAQRWGVAVAAAAASRRPELRDAIVADARLEVDGNVIEDGLAAAALMAMNNVYYRFRHLVGKPSYADKPARLRMNRLARPATNKLDFELFSLAVSAINGCETCITAHEKVVIEGGLSEDHVHDAVRIAAVVHAAAVSLELGSAL
jgi:AhpD family alkylhydroperoxidase